jgi:hypothetical protein
MSELAVLLAGEARAVALRDVLRQQRSLTIDQLHELVHEGKYAEELAEIPIGEILEPVSHKPPLAPREGESERDAIMRVFRACPDTWLSSSFFVRHVGLPRWTAQGRLAQLADDGLLERRGKTAATRYRLARPSAPGAGPRLGPKE